jgi:hypothetical protein
VLNGIEDGRDGLHFVHKYKMSAFIHRQSPAYFDEFFWMEQKPVSFRRIRKIYAESVLGQEHIQQSGFSCLPCAKHQMDKWSLQLFSQRAAVPAIKHSSNSPLQM